MFYRHSADSRSVYNTSNWFYRKGPRYDAWHITMLDIIGPMKRSKMLDTLFYMIKVSWSHNEVSNEEHTKRLLDDWRVQTLYNWTTSEQA